jgi:hypothetical protein
MEHHVILLMSDKQLYVNSWGTQIILDTEAESLADISSITIKILKPDATILSKTGYVLSATSVKVYYITEEGDINQQGDYQFKAILEWVTPSKKLPTKPFTRDAIPEEF